MSSRGVIARRQASANAPLKPPNVPGSLGTVANSNARRGPVTSMNSQVAFSQAQQQQQQQQQYFNLQQQQQMNQPVRQIGVRPPGQNINPQYTAQQLQQFARNGGPGQGQQGQMMNNYGQQQPQGRIAPHKMTFQQAMGLATLRLGKLEEEFIKLQEEREYEKENGIINGGGGASMSGENSSGVDKAVLDDIIKQLETLTKQVQNSESKPSNPKSDALLLSLQKSNVALVNENKQLKQYIQTLSNNLNNQIGITNKKFSETQQSINQLSTSVNELEGTVIQMQEQIEQLESSSGANQQSGDIDFGDLLNGSSAVSASASASININDYNINFDEDNYEQDQDQDHEQDQYLNVNASDKEDDKGDTTTEEELDTYNGIKQTSLIENSMHDPTNFIQINPLMEKQPAYVAPSSVPGRKLTKRQLQAQLAMEQLRLSESAQQ